MDADWVLQELCIMEMSCGLDIRILLFCGQMESMIFLEEASTTVVDSMMRFWKLFVEKKSKVKQDSFSKCMEVFL